MKTVIYYFTGTGNTLAIAKMFQKQFPEVILQPIIQNGIVSKIDLDAENIGIFFPVYMWSVPIIVERFVRENDFSNTPYVFAVTNYGGNPGYAVYYLNQLLKIQKTELKSSFGMVMPGNYTPMYGAWSEEKQQKTFKNAESKISYIIDTIKNKRSIPLHKKLGILGWFITMVLYKKIMIKKLPGLDKNFHVDENCIGCGKCAKVCPVNNIVMNNKKPVWQHKCEQCFACLQVCPVFAIQSGKMTRGRKRYCYPGYKFDGHNL